MRFAQSGHIHYKWCFSVHGSTGKKWIDIRKPRGRLVVLDLIYYPAVSRNRAVLRAGTWRAALNGIFSGQNVEFQHIEAKSARRLATKISKMEIVDT